MSRDTDRIVIEDLSHSYGARRAVSKVSFIIERGDILAVLGPNGAGKTTLLKLLATLLRPKSGFISYFGLLPVDDPAPVKRMLGYLAHETLLYKDLTVRDNLIFYGGLYGLSDPKGRAEEVLEMIDLSTRAGDPARSLSKGMRQRLSIGRAILHDPELLLLDEPFAALDVKAAASLKRIIEGLRARGKTVVFTTHDFEGAARLANSFLLMSEGKVAGAQKGPLKDAADLKSAFMTAAPDGEWP